MNELKKEIKKFYIMFGIEAPAAFFLTIFIQLLYSEKAVLP